MYVSHQRRRAWTGVSISALNIKTGFFVFQHKDPGADAAAHYLSRADVASDNKDSTQVKECGVCDPGEGGASAPPLGHSGRV